jgi:LPPG:FO 2-phospho-L-lactate transferase
MMRELGREPSPISAAGEYLRLLDGYIIDHEDAALAEGVRSLGIDVMVAQTVMRTAEARVSLARAALEFAARIREAREEAELRPLDR